MVPAPKTPASAAGGASGRGYSLSFRVTAPFGADHLVVAAEHLTEVNITSPTTIVQINQVNGIRADRVMVDELERMWRERADG